MLKICSYEKIRFVIPTLTALAVTVVIQMSANPTIHGAIFQNNPFADTDEDDSSSTSAPAATSEPTVEKVFELTADNERSHIGLVVRSVRRQNPQTPAELAQALSDLINVQAWADARVYLAQLSKVVMNDKELYDLYTDRGAEFFYILHSVERLAPDSQRFAKRVLGAAKNYATSDARIRSLVKTLADPNINVRSTAFRKIKKVGPQGYAAMLEVFGDAALKELWPGVRGAVRLLEDDATEILVAGATCGNPQIEVESYYGLANLGTNEAIDLISFLYLSPKTPQNVKTFAERRLREYFGGTIDRSTLIANLSRKANLNLREQRKNVGSTAKVSVWQYQAASNMFEPKLVSLGVASRIRAAKLARLLFEIDPYNSQNRELFLLASIESAKKLAGPDTPIDAKAVLKQLGNPSAFELNRLLNESLHREIIPASIGICELLKEVNDSSVLYSRQGGNCPLVKCILSGERYLQFAAMDAIAGLDPKMAYAGSSYVVDFAAFVSNTRGQQQVLVGHYGSNDSRSFEGVVSGTGAKVEAVRNGLEFYKAAIGSPDWKLLLLTDNMLRPRFNQVIQQLRADWRTRYLPIGVVVSNEQNRLIVQRLAQSDPLIRIIDLNFDTQLVNSQLALFEGLSSSWELTDTSRVIHAAVATQWLAKLASNRQQYGFYNLHKHEDAIYKMLYVAGQTRHATEIAAKLGTARAQRELVNYASQNGLDLASRQAAVDGFLAAVKEHGVLLTTDEIRLQYGRYNSSATQSKEVQAIFGAMLDAIEKKPTRMAKAGPIDEL